MFCLYKYTRSIDRWHFHTDATQPIECKNQLIMKASKTHELVVTDVPASELWNKAYSGLRYVDLFRQLLPQVLLNVEVLRGDGGVGTVLEATLLSPGSPSPPVTFKEEFVEVDDERYVKETRVFEGDFQKLGFVRYGLRFEVVETGPGSSVVKSSVVYEFDDGRPELEAAVTTTPFALAARAIVKYVKDSTIRPAGEAS